MVRILRRRVSGAGASRGVVARRCAACARSPSSPPPSCPRASASSKPRRKAAPSSRSRARPGIATASSKLIAACGGAIVYPVAVGLVSAAHAIPLAPTMHAFLHALVSNWISAGARLVPLGQTDSQRVLACSSRSSSPPQKRALQASLDDLGSATFRADLASMRHETQYTRLFGHEGAMRSPHQRVVPCERRDPYHAAYRLCAYGAKAFFHHERRGYGSLRSQGRRIQGKHRMSTCPNHGPLRIGIGGPSARARPR
jgi:hypothetical protein